MRLLDESFQELKRLFPQMVLEHQLRDHVGRFAFLVRINSTRYVLCAKRSMNGNIVSVDQEIYKTARTYNTKIVLYFKDQDVKAGRFYVYPWKDIDDCADKYCNIRNEKTMVNFPLRVGINLLKLIAKAA